MTDQPVNSSLLPSTPTQFKAGGKVSLSADLSAAKNGAPFDIEVLINTPDTLRGAQWSLKFDPAALHCLSFEEGSFFKDWASHNNGATLVFPQPIIDNQTGEVSDTGISIMGGSGGASGQGTLGVYHFTALTDSPAMPELLNSQVADQDANLSDIAVK